MTRLRSNCLQLETQLDFFRQITDQLDEQRQIAQIDVFETLALKLDHANGKLKRLCGRRRSYALQKPSLDKAIAEVEEWQRLAFDPLWFAMTKVQIAYFDEELACAKESKQTQGNKMIKATIAMRNPLRDISSAAVFLPLGKLESAKTAAIAFSSVKSVEVDGKWRLLDSVSDLSKDTVRELAVRLKKADPSTFGLLECLGAVHDKRHNEFGIIFRMPSSMSEPETLRAKIMARDTIHSLSDRFRLATQLARAVFSVHTFDMVHKSIRPENIILFRDLESTLGSAFLLGFGSLRREEDGTRLTSDTDWAKNLYRHPQRQGLRIRDRYIMQHDIYSLGVCLLEIGLWTSFVEYAPDQSLTRSQTYDFCAESSDDLGYPELVKSCFLTLAIKELPGKMGTKYATIVESCLTCLDLGNEAFGEEPELQEDGINIAIRYIEKVSPRNKRR